MTLHVSKVVERLLNHHLQPFFESTNAFGESQFAYTKGRGANDALCLLMLNILTSFEAGCRVGFYCSDVSGAFDRVNPERLCSKLDRQGTHPNMVAVLRSWLGARVAQVVVDGFRSECYNLQNSVYQGTVLGPPLWNCYYADARLATQAQGFNEIVFADDLNCFKAFDSLFSDEAILQNLTQCQTSLHRWGCANQVLFDRSKESFHILHPRCPLGSNFKLLGVTIDTRLVMDKACFEIASRAAVMVRRILRCRRFFTVSSLIGLYKAHVLSFVEYYTAAIYHAPTYFLSAVDSVQDLFLSELDLTAESALLDYNLAPLNARRDMAMLGLLHKVVLKKALDFFATKSKQSTWLEELPAAPHQAVT